MGFKRGLKDSLPIAAGYLPIAFTFGVTAVQAGLSPRLAVLISAMVFAGGSQFMLVSLISAGGHGSDDRAGGAADERPACVVRTAMLWPMIVPAHPRGLAAVFCGLLATWGSRRLFAGLALPALSGAIVYGLVSAWL